MEDILASIRRILNEDQTTPAEQNPPPPDVLDLDQSMLVQEGDPHVTEPNPDDTRTAGERPPSQPPSGLVAPEAAAAATASVGALLRTLSERGAQISRGGPTLEDMVREEMRPLVKEWLDANLPGLVERLVRAEIERLVNRLSP